MDETEKKNRTIYWLRGTWRLTVVLLGLWAVGVYLISNAPTSSFVLMGSIAVIRGGVGLLFFIASFFCIRWVVHGYLYQPEIEVEVVNKTAGEQNETSG